MESSGRDFFYAYPFDGKQINKLVEAQELMIELAKKKSTSPGISAVQVGSNESKLLNNSLKLKPKAYADETQRSKSYSLLAPIAESCNSQEILFGTNDKESKEGWNLYTAKNEENDQSNDEFLIALLTFKDSWHAVKLKEALQISDYFTSRSMISNKAPALLLMFKKKDLEDRYSSLQEDVGKITTKFKELLGIFSQQDRSINQRRL